MSGPDRHDLRRMLDELADETPEVPAQEWLAGTRHKVRVRRRARWAGAAVGAALVCAAAAVVPQVVEDAGTEPAPVEKPPSDGQAGWPLPDGTDSERLIATRMNEPGTSAFRWDTRKPPRTMSARGETFRLPRPAQFCVLPKGGTDSDEPAVQVVSAINGRTVLRSTCHADADFMPVGTASVRESLVRTITSYGGEGNSLSVSMWLEQDGQPVDVPGAAFGFAMWYECRGNLPDAPGGAGSEACGSVFDPLLIR